MSDGQAAEVMSRPLAKGWQWIQLGKYVENLDGRRVPVSQRERETRRGDFPYYGASGVIDSIDGHTHDGEFVLIGEDGANLLTRSKPIAFQAKGKIWVNNHAHVLRCKPGYSNAYLAYYINSIDLSPYVTGTAQPKLSQSMMNKIPVPVAPPEQQVEIVAEIEKQFSRLDEAVTNLQRVKANLKRYKAAVLKAAVEGRLVETEASIARREGRPFQRAEELLKEIREQQGDVKLGRSAKSPVRPVNASPLHDGWTWTSLGELLSERIVNGLSIKESSTPTQVRALRLSAMRGESIDFSDFRYLPISPSEVKDIELAEGDIFVSRGNGSLDLVGRACIAGSPPAPTIFPDTMMRLRFTRVAPVADWVFGIWPCRLVRTQIEDKVKTTAGIYKIAQPELASVRLPFPPLAEQRRIVAEVDRRLSILREVEIEVDTNLLRAQALRQSVLAKAFSPASSTEGLNA